MSLPEKLIAVGMKYNPGAIDYIKGVMLPLSVALRPENNKEATGGIAYVVYHEGKKLAYIREADLGMLKREASLGTEVCKQPSLVSFPTLGRYDITEARENYLVLKLRKNPCAEIYLEGNIATGRTTSEQQKRAEAFVEASSKFNNTKGKENMFDKIVNANKAVAVSAAYLEAGRIANNQVTKLVAAKAPLMVKGYVDTPVGKVVLANLTNMAIEQFRPTDLKLQKVGKAMMTEAYQELIQTIDIEGMLNELTSSEGIKNALAAVTEPDLVKA